MTFIKKPEHIKVKRTYSISESDITFEGKLEHIIEILQDYKNEGEWEGIEKYYEMYASCPCYRLYKYTLETDYEYERRMKELEKEEQKQKEIKEQRRKQYEELKKEFGND